MAARLWPKAWLYWLASVLGSFALLEDAGFRRELHPTLSRVLARWLGYLSRWVAVRLGLDPERHRWIGPTLFSLCWAGLGVHVYLTEADEVGDAHLKGPSPCLTVPTLSAR